jgi:glycosyltransferase involved in cell wall biosynthesis
MACGTCVVGSDSGEIPTLINTSGGGRVFPEASPSALADVLQQLIADDSQRETFARIGGVWANNHISLPAVATSVGRVMEGALAGT